MWNTLKLSLKQTWLTSWRNRTSILEWEVHTWLILFFIDFLIWIISKLNKKILRVIKCNSNMECQFCSQPIQVPKLTLISNTVTCHNVILKITDGKCLRVITITLWFQEEIIETRSERPYQQIFKQHLLTLSIKTTVWLLVKEPKLVFSKASWWSLQIFSLFIHLEKKA